MPATIKIVSDKDFIKNEYKTNIGTASSSSDNLSFISKSNSYYNSCFKSKKDESINFASFIINTSLLNINPRGGQYVFKLPIRNLHANDNYRYWSDDNPSKKQKVEDIYWGFSISLTQNSRNETITLWLNKRLRGEFVATDYTFYNLNDAGWKESLVYPDCESDYSSDLKISSYKHGVTYITWGNLSLPSLPYYVNSIRSITVMVGCQANVKFDKATLDLYGYCDENYLQQHYQSLSDMLSNKKYFTAKNQALKLIFTDNGVGVSTESNYYILAYCQLMRNEFDDCLKTSSALIKFNGDLYKESLLLSGYAKEGINDLTGALSDYDSAGDIGIEAYNSLSQKLKQNHEPLQKSSSTRTQIKPSLTK